MSIIFKYVHVPRSDGTLRHAPFIPISVLNRFGKKMEFIALLDSGADTTVVPKDFAEFLGLKEDKVEIDTGGIGGSAKARKSRLNFKIVGNRERYSLSVPCLVIQDRNADLPILLGRHGFFEQFHITIKQDQEKIYLKKIQSKKKY